MYELVALTLALVVAGWLLIYLMARAFYRGIGWFDSRAEHRRMSQEMNRRELRRRPFIAPSQFSAIPKNKPARATQREDDDEWAEIIDI